MGGEVLLKDDKLKQAIRLEARREETYDINWAYEQFDPLSGKYVIESTSRMDVGIVNIALRYH